MVKYLTISLKEEDYEFILTWCRRNDVPVSNIMRKATKLYILSLEERYEQG